MIKSKQLIYENVYYVKMGIVCYSKDSRTKIEKAILEGYSIKDIFKSSTTASELPFFSDTSFLELTGNISL